MAVEITMSSLTLLESLTMGRPLAPLPLELTSQNSFQRPSCQAAVAPQGNCWNLEGFPCQSRSNVPFVQCHANTRPTPAENSALMPGLPGPGDHATELLGNVRPQCQTAHARFPHLLTMRIFCHGHCGCMSDNGNTSRSSRKTTVTFIDRNC